MIKRMLDLSSAENVKKVVQINTQYEYDVDFVSGRYIVDAKSILGVFSLDLQKPVEIVIHSEQAEKMLQELEPYLATEE